MSQKIESVLHKVLFALCALAVGFSILSIVLEKPNPSGLLYVACAAFVVLLFFLYRFFCKHEVRLRKAYPYVLIGLAIWFAVSQSLLGMLLETTPVCDFGNVYDGARDWVEQGTPVIDWNREYYFYIYPHNLGLAGFLAGFYSLVYALGGDNLYLWAVILFSVMTSVTLILVVDIVRRTTRMAAAYTAAAACFLLPMYYLSSAAFYTDVASFLFPVLFLWLWMVGKDKLFLKRIGLDIAMAVSAFIGFKIKATVVIMPVAIFLCDLIARRWRTLLVQVPLLIAVFVVGSSAYDSFLFNNYLDTDLSAQYKFPITNWLAIGNRHDESTWVLEDTYSVVEDYQERNEMAIETWKNQFKTMAEQGKIFAFYTEKAACDFGGGTLGIEAYLDDFPWNDNVIQTFAFEAGEGYPAYRDLCTGIMLALWLLTLAGALTALARKQGGAWACPQAFVALLGIFVFLMLWEPSDRYFSNYYAVLIVAGIIGLSRTADMFFKPGKEKSAAPRSEAPADLLNASQTDASQANASQANASQTNASQANTLEATCS